MAKPSPVMYVVAGPPGGGKSSLFPVKELGFDYFDADARAAELNGSYRAIPAAVRAGVNVELEAFIEHHITEGKSFAFETTLRSSITFGQAKRAREGGFSLIMTYVALCSADLHVERVAARADEGGHSASPRKLHQIHGSSMRNLQRALREFDFVALYDNSGAAPDLAAVCQAGRVTFVDDNAPLWVRLALSMGGVVL